MLLEMFVNELSLIPAAPDLATGQGRARQFVLTMTAATRRGVRRALHLPEDFFAQAIGPDYYWKNWLADSRVERELRQFFRSLATKAPFLRDDRDTEAVWADIDCLCDGKAALGLKAAYVADGLALSLSSGPEWDRHLIDCEVHEIVDDDVSCRSESVPHASSPGHVENHTDWFQKRIQTTVADGRELWRHSSDFFPCLLCCSAVEDQMANLPANSLASIVRGLSCLNVFCADWQSGAFQPDDIGCSVSPEKGTTLAMYGAERTFSCPDGEARVFSWHAKVGQWRIYFDPAPGPGRLFVSYVGKHLPTAKFR